MSTYVLLYYAWAKKYFEVISREYFLVEKAPLDGLPDELRWFGVLLSLVGVVGDNRSDEGVAHCSCAT